MFMWPSVKMTCTSSNGHSIMLWLPEVDCFLCMFFLESLMSLHQATAGKLSRRQLSKEQMQFYIKEENNRRKHLLEKYIQLCNESKVVVVDTMLVESNSSTKSILELIVVANISNLVMGTKQSPLSRYSYI